MAPAVSRVSCLLIPLNLPAPVPQRNFGPRGSCSPFPSGRKPPSPLAAYRSSSPGCTAFEERAGGQCASASAERVMASRPDPKRRLFLKAERVGKRRAETQRGCRRGLEGGAPWGGSPKQHPPSPVRRTHHLKRKYEHPQSRPGASAPRHQYRSGKHAGSHCSPTPPSPGGFRSSLKAPAASATFAFRAPSKGRFPSKSAPPPGACKPPSARAPPFKSAPSSPLPLHVHFKKTR